MVGPSADHPHSRVRLRAVEQRDAEALRAMHLTPEVSAWWGSMDEGFPFGDDPTATRFTIEVDGEPAGIIQYGEEDEPDYRHAWIDVFVATAQQGRGAGTDAVRTMVRHLVDDRGHHRVTIDPTVENVAAVRAYEKAGFARVGVMRLAERSPEGAWRDALLMEQVFPAVAGLTSDENTT
jgi:aminoglycoside 6'-N-acetyltransferase